MLHNPEILSIQMSWHACFRYLGMTAVLIFLFVYCRRALPPAQWLWLIVLAVFFLAVGLGGARLFSIFEISLSSGEPPAWELLFVNPKYGWLRWYGSMLLYVLLLPLVLRGITPAYRWKWFDLFGLSTCLFIVFAKQGCQFSGDGCYGTATTLPWGCYYQWGDKPSILPVHPTPVYDSLFHLFFFFYLLRRWKRSAFDGHTGLLFFAGSAAFCIALEVVRSNPPAALGLTLAQWTYLAILPVAWLIFQSLRRNRSAQKRTQNLPGKSALRQAQRATFIKIFNH